MEHKKSNSLVERLKQAAMEQKRQQIPETKASSQVVDCPQCGAGRAINDGLTACGYCGYRFTSSRMSDGINIKEKDNSR